MWKGILKFYEPLKKNHDLVSSKDPFDLHGEFPFNLPSQLFFTIFLKHTHTHTHTSRVPIVIVLHTLIISLV